MKYIIVLLLSVFSINAMGQNTMGQIAINNKIENDTTLKIIYTKPRGTEPAYFLNGEQIQDFILKSLPPKEIANIHIEKDSMAVEGKTYYGKVYITTKDNYQCKLITLNQLKQKHTYLKDKDTTIFEIDGDIITEDPETRLVDENNLSSIYVDKFKYSDLNYIKIYTKQGEKQRPIRIRGNKAS